MEKSLSILKGPLLSTSVTAHQDVNNMADTTLMPQALYLLSLAKKGGDKEVLRNRVC